MPASRTDGAGGGYQVSSIEAPSGMDGDFRLLGLRDIYQRVMLEDDESIAAAAEGWNVLGQRLFVQGQHLKQLMTTLSDSWQSEAATLMAERVEAAVTSFDRWSQIAIGRSYEMLDLAAFVSAKKLVLEDIWRDFHKDAGKLLTPPANLTLEQRTQWREESADADALYANLEHHTIRALDMVVNPLANRYAEAALAFATPGPVYAGPLNAAIPSDEALAAMTTGWWVPEMPPLPGVVSLPTRPAAPAAPEMRAAPSADTLSAIPALPALPASPGSATLAGLVRTSVSAPAVPRSALGDSGSAPVVPQFPATTTPSLGLVGWAGAPALVGRHAPVALTVPSAPDLRAAPTVHSPGVPSAMPAAGRSAATPPAVSGRLGLVAAADSATAPHVPGSPGLPGTASPRRGLTGRSATAAPRSAAPPTPPSLPGSTRSRASSSGTPGTRVPGLSTGTARPVAPTAPHLLGREGLATAPPTASSPPPTLGTPRRPVERDQPSARPTAPARSAARRGDGVDPAIPAALRSSRTTGTFQLPEPARSRAAAADPRLSGSTPSGPAAPSAGPASTRASRTAGGWTPAGRTAGGRTSVGRHRAADAGATRTSQPDGAGRTSPAVQPEHEVSPARTARPEAAEVRELRGRPAVPAAKHRRKSSTEQERSTPARPDTQELSGRAAAEPSAPTRADQRAAERAHRRAEWTEARRRHEASLSR